MSDRNTNDITIEEADFNKIEFTKVTTDDWKAVLVESQQHQQNIAPQRGWQRRRECNTPVYEGAIDHSSADINEAMIRIVETMQEMVWTKHKITHVDGKALTQIVRQCKIIVYEAMLSEELLQTAALMRKIWEKGIDFALVSSHQEYRRIGYSREISLALNIAIGVIRLRLMAIKDMKGTYRSVCRRITSGLKNSKAIWARKYEAKAADIKDLVDEVFDPTFDHTHKKGMHVYVLVPESGREMYVGSAMKRRARQEKHQGMAIRYLEHVTCVEQVVRGQMSKTDKNGMLPVYCRLRGRAWWCIPFRLMNSKQNGRKMESRLIKLWGASLNVMNNDQAEFTKQLQHKKYKNSTNTRQRPKKHVRMQRLQTEGFNNYGNYN